MPISLRDVPAARIVAAVADAAERWQDADFPPRVRATRATIERTGYTEPVVDYALDRLFGALARPALIATIESELGSLDALDGFVARAGRPDVWYRGVERAAIVASDTTIGVAVPHLAFALCAKAGVIVKDRSDALARAFLETACDERPEIAPFARAEAWSSDDHAATRRALARAETVLAFGGDDALRAIRAELEPNALFVPFGHRTSVGFVSRATLATSAPEEFENLATAIARDALLYDGEGCLSLHALFVDAAHDADGFVAFAERVARACERVSIEFPPSSRALAPPTAAYRAGAMFRAAQGNGAVFGGAAAPFVVVAGAPLDELPPLAPRTLALYRANGFDDLAAFVRRHAVPLEAIGLGPSELADASLARAAASLGGARLCALGEMQAPPLGGNHGGFGRILPFVRAVSRDQTRRESRYPRPHPDPL